MQKIIFNVSFKIDTKTEENRIKKQIAQEFKDQLCIGVPTDQDEIGLKKLAKQLDNEKLWQSGQIKKYYIRLTDIVRVYMRRQFHINAMEMITPEIISIKGKASRPYLSKNFSPKKYFL